MLIVFVLLVLPIAGAPFIPFDEPLLLGSYGLLCTLSASMAASSLSPNQATYLQAACAPVIALAAIPTIWMVMQLMPLGLLGLSNSVWEAAADAMGRPTYGSITVNPSATLQSLLAYLMAGTLGIVSAVVSVDQKRADAVLFLLTGCTVTASLALIGRQAGMPWLVLGSIEKDSVLISSSVVGAILSFATGVRIYDRYFAPESSSWGSMLGPCIAFGGCFIGSLITWWAVLSAASDFLVFTFFCGLMALFLIILVRRILLGRFAYIVLFSAATFLAILLLAFRPGYRVAPPAVAFAEAPSSVISLTERMLADTPWYGTGAGTFARTAAVFREPHDAMPISYAPTAIAAIQIELGWPMMMVSLAGAASLAAGLLRAAVTRQRNSVYAATGAACVISLMLMSFANVGPLQMPLALIATATIGLAVGQSRNRSLHQA